MNSAAAAAAFRSAAEQPDPPDEADYAREEAEWVKERTCCTCGSFLSVQYSGSYDRETMDSDPLPVVVIDDEEVYSVCPACITALRAWLTTPNAPEVA